jgi:hypothetical protein
MIWNPLDEVWTDGDQMNEACVLDATSQQLKAFIIISKQVIARNAV